MKKLSLCLLISLAACGGGGADSDAVADTTAANGNTTVNIYAQGSLGYDYWSATEGLSSEVATGVVAPDIPNGGVLALSLSSTQNTFNGISVRYNATEQRWAWFGLNPTNDMSLIPVANFLADGNFLAICNTRPSSLKVLASTNLHALNFLQIRGELKDRTFAEFDNCLQQSVASVGSFRVTPVAGLIHTVDTVETAFTPDEVTSMISPAGLTRDGKLYRAEFLSYTMGGNTVYFVVYHEQLLAAPFTKRFTMSVG